MIASVVATKAAAAAQVLLNVALNACPIIAIVTAIGLLVVAVKKIGDKFGWWSAISNALSGVLEWVGEKVGWLWDKIKSFFGWDDEPTANANFDSIGEHAEEAAKTTDDAFGTATSNVNKYLDSIHFNATTNKLIAVINAIIGQAFKAAFNSHCATAAAVVAAVLATVEALTAT